MDTIHDGASRQRLSILPRLALHGSAGLVAIVGAGLIGHMMMSSDDPRPAPATAPATAQIYVLPDDDAQPAAEATAAIAPDASAPLASAMPEAPQPVAAAAIPPKPVAKPAIKATARSCEGANCESWETIVNKALATGPATQSRPAPITASAPRNVMPINPAPTAAPLDDPMMANEPRFIEREGPTSIGGMARSATTAAAATVVTQSSKLVDNLMRWSETAVSGVGIRRDHIPPEPLPN